MSSLPGVSFVIPVHNGGPLLEQVIGAVLAQDDGRPFEVLVVDDDSDDRSSQILERLAADPRLRVVRGEGRGAAAALNLGIANARYPVVCQVDQDVIVGEGWMMSLLAALDDPSVWAVQGYYLTSRDAPLLARVMGYDLELRYAAIRGDEVDHVCTGNSAYCTETLKLVSLFDESLGYGYDNDMSYRLLAAGGRLRMRRDARSLHRWRETLGSYLAQQYGLGYGRLDLVARHPQRVRGDAVSRLGMILHAPAMLAVLVLAVAIAPLAAAGGPWRVALAAAAVLLAALAGERLVAGVRAAVRFRDPAALLFLPVHLLRDVAWAAAILLWAVRRLLRRPPQPRHSMSTRGSPP